MRASRVTLLNGSFDAVDTARAVEVILRLASRGERGWIATVNVAILMSMRDDRALQRYVDRAALTVADGQPLVWLSRLCGSPLPERVAGVDMVSRVAARAGSKGLRLGLLGSSEATIQRVREKLELECGHPVVACAQDGYFSADEAADKVRSIRNSHVDILFVGMGVPRQEQFIERWWDQLGCAAAIGVGGSFEVIAGVRKRAPIYMQRAGLEWFYRLAQEPRRLFKRYLVTNLRFLALVPRAIVTSVTPKRKD